MSQIREVMNDSQIFTEFDRHRNDIMLLLRSPVDGRRFIRPLRCPFSPKRTRKEQQEIEAYKIVAQANLGIFYCAGFESSFPVCLRCPEFTRIATVGFPDGMKVKLEDIYSKNLIPSQSLAR